MSVPAVVFLAVDLVASVAVLAFIVAFVRQGRRLAATVRRFAEEAGPAVEAIGRGTSGRGR